MRCRKMWQPLNLNSRTGTDRVMVLESKTKGTHPGIIKEEEKVDVASMHLEGDAIDFYSWISNDQTIEYWGDLVRALQRNFGPTEFQNPDEHLCSVKQTGTVQEYRQEFAKPDVRIQKPRTVYKAETCHLEFGTAYFLVCIIGSIAGKRKHGVFLNGLKEELKADVRIQKPRTVYKAVSIALEFESKINHTCYGRGSTWTTPSKSSQPESKATTATSNTSNSNSKPPLRISDVERQSRYLKGECYRCGEKYGPGHRCKTGTFKVLEVEEEPEEQPTSEVECIAGDTNDVAEIILHAILGKPHPKTMKVQVAPFGVQIGNGDFIRCGHICKDLPIQINELKIVQDFYCFSIGGADLVLGIQWLETLNTVQANWIRDVHDF
nr:retrotransposon Gag domain, retroviral aspartyl protease [Tanacetum cinerariifolium]